MLNSEGCRSTCSSVRLSKCASGSHIMTHVCRSRSTATVEGSVWTLDVVLTHSLPTFPVVGNRTTRRKPMTFDRVLTNSCYIVVMSPQPPIPDPPTPDPPTPDPRSKGSCSDVCTNEVLALLGVSCSDSWFSSLSVLCHVQLQLIGYD